MKIIHWLKEENSGLFRTTAELTAEEIKQGHAVSLRNPFTAKTFFGFADDDFDIHCVHSQIHPHYHKDNKPKVLFLHGEPDYGMLHKISVNAIMTLAPIMDAFIAFNEQEATIWNSFKRTVIVPKGVNLEMYRPIDTKKKLQGQPAILYAEHWRSFRHPLHVFIAMERVMKKLPKAKFYPFGCPKEDKDFWMKLIKQNQYTYFTKGVFQPQTNMPGLLNLADIVVSPVFPSYGRVSLEALACDKPVVAYKTNPHATYVCEPYNPDDMAEKIIQCYEEKPTGMREYAEKNLSITQMAERAIEIYRKLCR